MNRFKNLTGSLGIVIRLLVFAVLVLTITSCTVKSVKPPHPNQAVVNNSPPTAKMTTCHTPTKVHPLDSELLYDLLLSKLAEHRGDLKTALDALSRAAYSSRNKQVTAQAARLALHQKDYQRAIELSNAHATLAPQEHSPKLIIALAQLRLGQYNEAATQLINLASSLPQTEISVLHSIATILTSLNKKGKYDPLQVFDHANKTRSDSAQVSFVRALIAKHVKNKPAFEHSIEQALELSPNWSPPATLKLIELSQVNDPKLHLFASNFLARNARESAFRMQYGQILVDHKLFNQSIVQYKKVLAYDPKFDNARYLLGLIYYTQNKPNKAKRYLQQFLTRNPDSDKTRLYLSQIAAEQKNYKTAIILLQQIAADPYYFEAQLEIGQILTKKSGITTAITFLRQIDTHNKAQVVRIYLAQENLLRQAKLFKKAMTTLDEGLQRIPEHPDLLYSRGMLAAELNMLALHEKDLRLLIHKQPQNAQAYNALGYTLADKTKRYLEALNLIQKALTIKPDDPFILDSMGWVQYRLGNHKASLKFLNHAIKIMKDAVIAAHLGEVLWVLGDKRGARKVWQRGHKWEPKNEILQKTIEHFSNLIIGQTRSVVSWRHPLSPSNLESAAR